MATSMVSNNMPFIKQQFSVAVGNSSIVVKVVCLVVFLCYCLSFSSTILDFVSVTPGYVLPPNFWVWTYFTHSFIETHIWCVVSDICVLVLYGKLLEPLWGALEMVIFYMVTNFGVAVLTTLAYVGIYLVSRNTDYLFKTHIHGLAGYLAGFSVAVKQVMPDHVLVNSPFFKMRNKHVPLLLLVLAIIVRIVNGVDGPYPIMFGTGIIVSWIYLRFYQKHNNGNRGDMAESFTFASFFPDRINPVVAVVSGAIFNFLVKIKLCKKPQRKYDVSSPTTITVSLPGTDSQDAERRRQVALKALNERLSKQEGTTTWPSLESGEAKTDASKSTAPTEVKVEKDSGDKPAVKLPVPDFKETKASSESEQSSTGGST